MYKKLIILSVISALLISFSEQPINMDDNQADNSFIYLPVVSRMDGIRKTFYLNPEGWFLFAADACLVGVSCIQRSTDPVLEHFLGGYSTYIVFIYDDLNNAFVYPFVLMPYKHACILGICVREHDGVISVSNESGLGKIIAIFIDERLSLPPVSDNQVPFPLLGKSAFTEVLDARFFPKGH